MLKKLEWRLAALKNGLQDATAYRMEFFIEVFASAFVPACVQLILWYALFKVNGVHDISGYSYTEMIAYTLTSILFSQVRGGNHDFELSEMIRSGSLSQYLLKPVSVTEFIYLRGMGAKLFTAFICLILGLLATPWTDLGFLRLLGAMVLAILGNMIHYQIGAALATVSFKWEESYSVLMVKNLIVSILSGELIPLYLFPEKWSYIWKLTPFYLYVYEPTQFALGRTSVSHFLQQVLIGFIWLLVATATVRIAWKKGIKGYASLGS